MLHAMEPAKADTEAVYRMQLCQETSTASFASS